MNAGIPSEKSIHSEFSPSKRGPVSPGFQLYVRQYSMRQQIEAVKASIVMDHCAIYLSPMIPFFGGLFAFG